MNLSPRSYFAPSFVLFCVSVGACTLAGAPLSSDPTEPISVRGGSDDNLLIGFNGDIDQFLYADAFYQAGTVDQSPRLCHWYVPWNVAEQSDSATSSPPSGSGSSCDTSTLGRATPGPVPDNTCVQAISSEAGCSSGCWYQCDDGTWVDRFTEAGKDSCSSTYPLGYSGPAPGGASTSTPCTSTVLNGQQVPDNACVEQDDGAWLQCDSGTWKSRWTDPTACNGAYPAKSVVSEGGAGDEQSLAYLKNWLKTAAAPDPSPKSSKTTPQCDEVLISFKADSKGKAPSVSDYKIAFSAFLGYPWARETGFTGSFSFTPWNEPNNGGGAGDGLGSPLDPDTAAQYYLTARNLCKGICKTVAAGDFASNGGTWKDFDGRDSGSYINKYKSYIDAHWKGYSNVKSNAEVFAYHAWHDANGYTFSGDQCNDDNCVTNMLVNSLDDGWSSVDIWDTEVGSGQLGVGENQFLSSAQQACGVKFILRITEAQRRIKRVYYTRLYGNGGGQALFQDGKATDALQVLATRNESLAGQCDPVPGQFTNPIIPMFSRPPGVSADDPTDDPNHPSEGCPDPSIIQTDVSTHSFYIYCTSYTWASQRTNGFPIFWADHINGPWSRAKDASGGDASIITEHYGSDPRQNWPKWIKGKDGKPFGEFWAPDVHQLPAGSPWKFVAEYAAPCSQDDGEQCIGVAYASDPVGPWTLDKTDTPFVFADDKGGNSPGGMFYDPSLLITHDSPPRLYLYWAATGNGVPTSRGVYGRELKWDGDRLDFVSGSPTLIEQRCQDNECPYASGDGPGEGPYVIEHKQKDGTYAYYEFYSTGSLYEDYHVGVRRSLSPLSGLYDDGPKSLPSDPNCGRGLCGKEDGTNRILQRNSKFVATGGNSVVQNVDGVDFLAYHAIVVPSDGGCGHADRIDPTIGKPVNKTKDNPHCRSQGDRQAMLDAIAWETIPGSTDGAEWPFLRNETGSPSTGQAASVWK